MHPRLRQLAYRAVSRSRASLRELAEQQWIISPAEMRTAQPAIHLPDDLDRVTAVMEDTTTAQEMRRLAGGPIEHAATMAYRLRDVDLHRGSLYKRSVRHPLQRDEDVVRATTPAAQLAEVAVACTFYGSFYFGHWMTDDLSLQLLAQTVAPPLTVARTPYTHEPGYRDLFQLPTAQACERAHIRSLVLFDDFGQNRSKQARYDAMRHNLRQAVADSANRNERVFLRRGASGAARALVNAVDVETALIALGFRIVDPETMAAHDIAQAVAGAKIVCGVEGSHLVHGLFAMHPEGTLLTLQAPFRFNNPFKDQADCLGLRYAFAIGTACGGGFTLEPERIARVLDLIR